MRIVCPSCSAAYEVPDAMLGGAPRKMRCARCTHDWMPAELAQAEPVPSEVPPPPPPPAIIAGPEPLPAAITPPLNAAIPPPPLNAAGPRLVETPAHKSAKSGARLDIVAVAMTLLVLAGLGFGAYKYRSDIMAAWPPSQRVYAALGLGR